jgi:hypothetical protein
MSNLAPAWVTRCCNAIRLLRADNTYISCPLGLGTGGSMDGLSVELVFTIPIACVTCIYRLIHVCSKACYFTPLSTDFTTSHQLVHQLFLQTIRQIGIVCKDSVIDHLSPNHWRQHLLFGNGLLAASPGPFRIFSWCTLTPHHCPTNNRSHMKIQSTQFVVSLLAYPVTWTCNNSDIGIRCEIIVLSSYCDLLYNITHMTSQLIFFGYWLQTHFDNAFGGHRCRFITFFVHSPVKHYIRKMSDMFVN